MSAPLAERPPPAERRDDDVSLRVAERAVSDADGEVDGDADDGASAEADADSLAPAPAPAAWRRPPHNDR